VRLPITPSQTVGPFLAIGLPWPDGPFVVPEGTAGAITITGQVIDGADQPLPDAMVETWQADDDGRFDHAEDPRGAAKPRTAGFRGFGRCATDVNGYYRILTVKPGPLPAPDGGRQAPHLGGSVLSRGRLDPVVTRIYFADEAAANAADPVLASVDDDRRATLVAIPDPAGQPGEYRFDIRLRGDGETVFFDV
jgi:protocatechuate 3,4-dioxygenase alpha subunit